MDTKQFDALTQLSIQVTQLSAQMNLMFAQLSAQIDGVEKRLIARIDEKIAESEARTDAKLELLEDRMTARMDAGFSQCLQAFNDVVLDLDARVTRNTKDIKRHSSQLKYLGV